MGTYSVYLRTEEDEDLRKEANQKGITPLELLKKRVEITTQKDHFHALNLKMDALFMLLELLAAEIGYTSGATRAASSHVIKAVTEGQAIENSLNNAAQTLRAKLKDAGAEVSL